MFLLVAINPIFQYEPGFGFIFTYHKSISLQFPYAVMDEKKERPYNASFSQLDVPCIYIYCIHIFCTHYHAAMAISYSSHTKQQLEHQLIYIAQHISSTTDPAKHRENEINAKIRPNPMAQTPAKKSFVDGTAPSPSPEEIQRRQR